MQNLINFQDNYVSFDFENKPGQKIKIVGTYDNPYFCGKNVCAILEHKDIKQALFDLDKDYKKDLKTIMEEMEGKNPDSLIGIPIIKPTYHEGKAVYISKDGLVALLTKSRTLASYRASKVISDKLGLNLNFIYAVSKQQQTLDIIKAAFQNLSCISEYKIGTYRTDLYFPDLKLAVECDEHGHRYRDQRYEQEREEYIKNVLGCVFIRYNPDSSSFNIGDVLHEIMNIYQTYSMSLKDDKIDELSALVKQMDIRSKEMMSELLQKNNQLLSRNDELLENVHDLKAKLRAFM